MRAAAERRLAIQEAQSLVVGLGGSLDIDPLEALVESVREAAWNVCAYRGAIERFGISVGADGSVAVPELRDNPGVQNAAALHVLVAAYDAERDRLVKYAKVCVDAGVEERKVRIAEAQGGLMARVVQAAVDACDPTPVARQAAVQAAARELRAISGGT